MSRVAVNSVVVTVLNAGAQLASFVLFAGIAALFGADRQTDAFFLALAILSLLINPAVNSITSVFIPVITEWRIRQPATLGRLVGSSVIHVVAGSALAALGIGLMAPLGLATLGRTLPNGVAALATRQAILLLPTVVFQIVTSALAAIYNSVGRFWLPAAAVALRYIVTLSLILLLRPPLGFTSLPVSFVLGAALHVGLLVALWRHLGIPIEFRELRTPETRRLIQLSLPLIAGNVALQLVTVISRVLAASLPSGSVSVLDYAARMSAGVMELITSGVLLVTLADWSQVAARLDTVQLREKLSRTVLMVLFVILPVVAVLIALRESVVGTLLQRGRFDSALTPLTGAVLALFLLGVPIDVVGRTYVRLLLVWQDTWALAKLATQRLAATALLAVALVRVMQVRGLALAESLGILVVTVRLVALAGGRLGNTLSGLGGPLGKLALSAFAAWFVSAWAQTLLSTLSAWVVLPVAAILGGLTYLGVATLLQCQELASVVKLIATR